MLSLLILLVTIVKGKMYTFDLLKANIISVYNLFPENLKILKFNFACCALDIYTIAKLHFVYTCNLKKALPSFL